MRKIRDLPGRYGRASGIGMEVQEKGSVVMHSKLLILFIALALGAFAWPLPSSSAAAQIRVIPGSAVGGGEIFKDKGCSDCHNSGGSHPLITQNETPSSLAAALWN